MNPGRTVSAAALGTDQADILQQCPVVAGAAALRSRSPSVIAADRQAQGLAHHPDRPDIAMLIDEPELHRVADPKMSTAFFRISRSIRSRFVLAPQTGDFRDQVRRRRGR